MSEVEVIEGYSLDDARQFALNRLVEIARYGAEHNALTAASLLLSEELDFIDFPIDLVGDDGVDDEDGRSPPLPEILIEGCVFPMCSAIDFDEEVLAPDPGVFLTDTDGSIYGRIYVFSHVNGELQ